MNDHHLQDHSGKHESESKTHKGKDIQNIDSSGNMPEKQVYSKLQINQNFATRLITCTNIIWIYIPCTILRHDLLVTNKHELKPDDIGLINSANDANVLHNGFCL